MFSTVYRLNAKMFTYMFKPARIMKILIMWCLIKCLTYDSQIHYNLVALKCLRYLKILSLWFWFKGLYNVDVSYYFLRLQNLKNLILSPKPSFGVMKYWQQMIAIVLMTMWSWWWWWCFYWKLVYLGWNLMARILGIALAVRAEMLVGWKITVVAYDNKTTQVHENKYYLSW